MTPYIYFLFSFHKLSYTGNNENLDNLKSLKISLTQCDFFVLKVLICDVFFSVCVTGIRIQTTSAGSIKRKYTIWGVSEKSANRKQFDVTDEGTGRTFKTTVADYFNDRYQLIFRSELWMIHITCGLSIISTPGRAYCGFPRISQEFVAPSRGLEQKMRARTIFHTRPLSDLPPPYFSDRLCDKPYRYSCSGFNDVQLANCD